MSKKMTSTNMEKFLPAQNPSIETDGRSHGERIDIESWSPDNEGLKKEIWW